MKEWIKDWFIENQTRVAIYLGLVCVLTIVAVGDYRWPMALVSWVFSLIFIFMAQRLYSGETSENWLRISYGEMLKNIFSGVLMLLGWTMFLRLVLGLAIGAAILKMD